MVSLFGLNKDKKKEKEKKKAEEEKKKSDDEQKESNSAADPQASQHTSQQPSQPRADDAENVGEHDPEDAIVSVQNVEEEEGESPSAAVNNEVATTSASGQAPGSISSESSAREKKEGVSRYGSSYEGGVEGRCATCGNLKIACNCQHCHICRKFVMTLSSRKHCRRCWRATCPKCASYERTNDFLRGEQSRTCKECAVPHSLLFLTELAYSSYEAVGATETWRKKLAEKEKEHGHRAKTVEDESATAATAGDHDVPHLDEPPLDTRPFRWGLYVLGCEMQAPRRCINPSCAHPISYDHVCHKCKLSTVTLGFHRLRHVAVADLTDTATSSSSKTAAITAEAVEEAVRIEYDAVASARTTAEEDDLFDAALPNDMESYLFASLQGNSWSSRKVLLSLVACAVAAESSAMPNISLAMTDLPAYAKLLRPVQTSDTFSVFSAPGHVRFIAFNSGASSRSSIHQILGTRMTAREAWTNAALKQSHSIAQVVASGADAASKHLTEFVAKVSVREGVLAYIAENDILRRLPEVVDKLAKEGLDVVLCGHGIGGAVATWVAATMLLENTADLKDRLMCVTFGAPLVFNHALTDLLMKQELHKNFQHFVNSSDMVPRMSYVDALLESGNTIGTASLVGHGEAMASAGEVREAVTMWVGKHEEPHGAVAPALRAGKDSGFSLTGFARRMRNSNSSDAKEKKAKEAEELKAASVTEDRAGDLFRVSREPFDNNVIRVVDEATAPTLHDIDFQRFATAEHRLKQTMDPCGCYHFLWHARGKYLCSDDPATAIGLLSDRTDLRVKLHDHLLSAYNKAMVEYIYSVSAEA